MDNLATTPIMSINTLVEFYSFLLKTNRIEKNGAAHSRLKHFESILEKRNKWRKFRNTMPKITT